MKRILNALDWALDHLPGPALVYIAAATTGLGAASEVIAEAAPAGGETVLAWLVRGAAALAGAGLAIRRVTEVADELRGLRLPRGTVLQITAELPDKRRSSTTKIAA